MSVEDQVLALIEEGNPVPDPNAIETLPAEPADYLATLHRRSSEVTQLDEKTRQPTGTNRKWLIAAAAAVLAMLAGVAIVLFNRSVEEEPPVVTEVPVTTSSIAETAMDPTGFWRLSPTRRLHLGDDGTYAWIVVGSMQDSGTWEQDGDAITFQSGADARTCTEGDSGTVQIDMPDDDTLTLSFDSDECGGARDIVPEDEGVAFERTDQFEIPEPLSPEEAAWQALPFLNAPAGELARLANFRPGVAFDSAVSLVPGVGNTTDDFAPLFLNSDPDQEAAIAFIRLDGMSPQDQQEVFAGEETFEISETEELVVDTAQGMRTRLVVLAPTSVPNSLVPFPLSPEIEYISYVFDVAGQTVLILGNLDVIDAVTFDDLATSIIWRDVGRAP